MATAVLPSQTEREVAVAIDDLVTELAMRVGKIVPRRNDARYPLNAPVAIGTLRRDGSFVETCRAWGCNLSCLGIGLITDRAMLVGEDAYVKFQAIDGREHVAPMRVMHCELLFGSVYRIGGQFLIERSW